MTEKRPAEDSIEPPETRMLRYLYIGKEYLEYQPGNWFVHNYFNVDRVPSIEEMAANSDTELKPIEIINSVFEKDKNLVQNYETIVFALAVCARQTKSEKLRFQAYSNVKKICSSPEHFLLFTKFVNNITKSSSKKIGCGHGWKRAVDDWYKSKSYMELAECVTRCNSRYGWKHKDILKLAHLPVGCLKASDKTMLPDIPDNILVKNITFCFITHGLKEVKKIFGDSNSPHLQERPNSLQVMKYLEKIMEFKHCEDEVSAASLLEVNNFTLEHVPGHFLKSEEMWNALMTSMNYTTLLENIQKLHNLGFLKPNSTIVSKIVDVLLDQEKLDQEKIHPAHILITIRNYENSGKPLSYEKRKVREEAKKQHPPPPEPNKKIVKTLYTALNLSFSYLEPTGLKYLITIDMSKTMQESRVWHCGNMIPAEVGCLLALSLLRSEKNVTIATYKNVGIHVTNFDKNHSFAQAYTKLSHQPTGIVNLNKPMAWATFQKKRYDVFINVVDMISMNTDTSVEGIKTYRTKMKLPDAKLINCVLCDSSYRKETVDKNVLTICGFDHKVPKIIEAFAKSSF